MRLHVAPRTRSIRALWLLEETGAQAQLVRRPEVAAAAVDPLDELPILEAGEARLSGSLAVLLFLAERAPTNALSSGLTSPERAEFLQWLVFSETVLDPLVVSHLRARPASPSELVLRALRLTSSRLTKRLVAVGETFTLVDVSLASVLHLANHVGLLGEFPELHEYVLRHTARPASRRAVMAMSPGAVVAE